MKDSAASLLGLDEISSLLPHLQVLTLTGNVASGDFSMLAPLQGSLRRLVVNACTKITGNHIKLVVNITFSHLHVAYFQLLLADFSGSLDDFAVYTALVELSIRGVNDEVVGRRGTS